MNRLETHLKGPVLLEPAVHGDSRGFFLETFRAQAMKEKEGTQAREEELQETIQRLKETMATKNVQGVEEGEAPLSRTCKLDPTA